MSSALTGDRESYRKLMIELGVAIEAYLRSRFGTAAPPDFLEDCVQESLLAVHQARHSYDTTRPFRPWLFTIVQNKTVDALRRRHIRERVTPLHEAGDQASSAVHSEPLVLLDGEMMLAWLEPKYRQALVLTKIEGLSIEEAAERAQVSTTAMKTRVHRAIRIIRKRLRNEDAL